jgi:hypothetical protein
MSSAEVEMRVFPRAAWAVSLFLLLGASDCEGSRDDGTQFGEEDDTGSCCDDDDDDDDADDTGTAE